MTARPAPSTPWNWLLPLSFAVGSAMPVLLAVLDPRLIGSHALIYTGAAQAWLDGGNPWTVGPRAVVFAGPPSMLAPYVPFVGADPMLTRVIWVIGAAVLAVWILRQLKLPGYWIAFPPLLEGVILGHPEILVLAALVVGGVTAGIAPFIKPYAGMALLAERNVRGVAAAAILTLSSFLILPWRQFVAELPMINENLARQARGDSVFGEPLLMVVALLALAGLGWRRGLWLSVPVLWPYAQPIYKTMTVPALSPVIAIFWALPVPGATFGGLVIEAALLQLDRRVRLPAWLRAGIGIEATRLSNLESQPELAVIPAPADRVALHGGAIGSREGS
jgi:hypothetical protein